MDDRPSQPPTRIGEFTLIRELATRRCTRVYLAESADHGRVTLTVLGEPCVNDRLARRRFARLIDETRRMTGAGVPEVLAAEASGPVPWMATTYQVGPTLAELVATSGPLTEPAVLGVVADVAYTLQSLHAAGIVHGEIDPSRIVIGVDRARLVDVGTVGLDDAGDCHCPEDAPGAFAFQAPERLAGDWAGAPADVFSLGAVAYYAATGVPPFGTGSSHDVAQRVADHEPDLAALANPRLRGVVCDCLVKHPSGRPDVEAVAQFARPQAAEMPPALMVGAVTPATGSTAVQEPSVEKNSRQIRRALPWLFGALVAAQLVWAAVWSDGQVDGSQNITTPSPSTPGTRVPPAQVTSPGATSATVSASPTSPPAVVPASARRTVGVTLPRTASPTPPPASRPTATASPTSAPSAEAPTPTTRPPGATRPAGTTSPASATRPSALPSSVTTASPTSEPAESGRTVVPSAGNTPPPTAPRSTSTSTPGASASPGSGRTGAARATADSDDEDD